MKVTLPDWLANAEQPKEERVTCDICTGPVVEYYRYTDWYEEYNDNYGTWEECLKLFKEAYLKDPKKRIVIYDVSNCSCGGVNYEEGVFYNEDAEAYASIKRDVNKTKKENLKK